MRALKERKARAESGLFVVEGIRHVAEAVEAGAPVAYLVYCPDRLTSPFRRDMVEQQRARGLPVHSVTAPVFATLSERENPTGLLAVVRQQRHKLAELSPANLGWGVAVVAPQDPGNLGTIVRTIDAVGANGLLLLDSGVDPYHPTAVRASLGSLFWVPMATATFAEFAGWARQHAYHLYGTSGARGVTPYQQVAAYQRPAILLLGSEREGLTDEQRAACEMVVQLPMRGKASRPQPGRGGGGDALCDVGENLRPNRGARLGTRPASAAHTNPGATPEKMRTLTPGTACTRASISPTLLDMPPVTSAAREPPTLPRVMPAVTRGITSPSGQRSSTPGSRPASKMRSGRSLPAR